MKTQNDYPSRATGGCLLILVLILASCITVKISVEPAEPVVIHDTVYVEKEYEFPWYQWESPEFRTTPYIEDTVIFSNPVDKWIIYDSISGLYYDYIDALNNKMIHIER